MTKRGDLTNVKDVYGNICIIDGRTKASLREILKNGPLEIKKAYELRTDKCYNGIGPTHELKKLSKNKVNCYYLV
jgi:hypothetical protein